VTARAATYAVAVIVALSFAFDLMRMPVQRYDALQDLLDVQRSSSVTETFRQNLGGAGSTGGSTLLRPLKFAQIKALHDLSGGRHYWLVFRGFHAALLVVTVLLFVGTLRVQTWTEFAAAGFALTVLTGIHTFAGTVKEAFPINHTIEIVAGCLLALNLARSRGGWLVDLAAILTFVACALILESGLIVWVLIAAAWASGLRGISTRAVAAVTCLLGVYLIARFFFLSVTYPGLAERNSGFLFSVLEGGELVRRFGDTPALFYAYNVGAAILSVLFAEPQSGVFGLTGAWLAGDVAPRLYIAVVSSTLATILIGWAAVGSFKRPWRDADDGRRVYLVFGAVLVSNAVLSFAYTKDEIVAPAGALYACAAFFAARHAITSVGGMPRPALRAAACLLLVTMASLWAFRSAGLHHVLRMHAFKQRNDWARFEESSTDPAAAALIRQLRGDALSMPVPNPDLFGEWTNRWWGE
jgi:hypothetical protein